MASETRERLYPRTEDQIKADIADARARLSASLEQLAKDVHPTTIRNETVDQVKGFVNDQVDSVKGRFVDVNGIRLDRVAAVAGAVAGGVATLLALRGVVRGTKKRALRRQARRELEAITGAPVTIRVRRG